MVLHDGSREKVCDDLDVHAGGICTLANSLCYFILLDGTSVTFLSVHNMVEANI